MVSGVRKKQCSLIMQILLQQQDSKYRSESVEIQYRGFSNYCYGKPVGQQYYTKFRRYQAYILRSINYGSDHERENDYAKQYLVQQKIQCQNITNNKVDNNFIQSEQERHVLKDVFRAFTHFILYIGVPDDISKFLISKHYFTPFKGYRYSIRVIPEQPVQERLPSSHTTQLGELLKSLFLASFPLQIIIIWLSPPIKLSESSRSSEFIQVFNLVWLPESYFGDQILQRSENIDFSQKFTDIIRNMNIQYKVCKCLKNKPQDMLRKYGQTRLIQVVSWNL
ncbi:Hypothetical_protein [Hexamita inflata]|uniref:Hypothetical_protein n=1 Tax=Hexamita inflata TaxID=28002 RepID=A0AA86P624_9EUKA|nr:Hypothetical protein HINF_LOCUS18759 [Hexamita inflata]